MDFDQLNETDVREEIVSPWLRALGYRSATEHNILRELSLRYPSASLGRKNPSRDPLLRGKADYVLEAGRRVRWVVEAKNPSSQLTADEAEQAWTYANHPEVRAVYFCLCNGRRLDVYQTQNAPSASPVLSFTFEQLQQPAHWTTLSNVLSPSSVLRDHPATTIDVSPPLAPGLRSVARITGGHINYDKSSINLPWLAQLETSITGGAVQRDERGHMVALVETRAGVRSIETLIQRLGLNRFEMTCRDAVISSMADQPNVFTYRGSMTFPAGEELLDFATWPTKKIPMNLRVDVSVIATGTLHGNCFSGRIVNHAIYGRAVPVTFDGTVELFIT
jgi:hypothetical protein